MPMKSFNVRVYGIYINQNKQVLVADEYIKGNFITKFPGGGLEIGEGTIDCIKRECIEEMGQEFEVVKHFYTTDFYQQSVFNPNHQIISIYYLIKPLEDLKFRVSDVKNDFEPKENAQSFRYISLSTISENDFTLPIDKHVAKMLKENN